MQKKIIEKNSLLKNMGCYVLYSLTLFLFASCGSSGGGGSDNTDEIPSGKAKWTYMVYIAGDNNLSTAAVGDINEMEQVGSDSDVNIVVQVEFSQQYSQGLPKNTLRGRITKDDSKTAISSNLTDIGNKNMGSKDTLTAFIKWAATTYPADHYALVLWDHGAGWKTKDDKPACIKGALEDDTSGSFMSLPDIADAVQASDVKPDLINFDACLMAMYEVAYEFNGLTDYMVFSEEVEPGEGDPYDTILKALTDNPDMTPETLSKTITQKYKTFYEIQDRSNITKSAIDMASVGDLHDSIAELASVMNSAIGTERPNIQSARDNSVQYDYPENHDIGSFLDHLKSTTNDEDLKNKINEVKTILGNMIISNLVYSTDSNDAIKDSSGLAIYIPKRDQVTDAELSNYSLLAINQTKATSGNSWGGFVNTLVTGDASDGIGSLQAKPGNFVIWLEWDTDADLDLIVWEPDGTFAAPYIGASSPNGFLSEDSAYSGESVEYYAAEELVEAGDYDILVEYYDDGFFTSGSTTAYLYLYDPEQGDDDFQLIDYRMMDLGYPAPVNWFDSEEEITNVIYGYYSDWWIPYTLTRSSSLDALSGEDGINPEVIGVKSIQIRIKPSKAKKQKKVFPIGDNTTQIKDTLKILKK